MHPLELEANFHANPAADRDRPSKETKLFVWNQKGVYSCTLIQI